MNNNRSANAAVIDVGSNSIRYMEAAVTDTGVTALFKTLTTTRLAAGLDNTGRLQPAPVERTLTAIRDYAMQADERRLPVYAYATSAVRDAQNRDDFCAAVYACTGIRVHVLSGDEEAALAYLGATNGDRTAGLIDIGGGSAQVITAAFRKSWPVGCVRMRERYSATPYMEALPEIAQYLSGVCELAPLPADRWVGVGGSITTLAALQAGLSAYDPARVSQVSISIASLTQTIKSLCAMGAKRKSHPLLRERHDVILYGAAVLLYLMDALHIPSLQASDADGMEGYLLYQHDML